MSNAQRGLGNREAGGISQERRIFGFVFAGTEEIIQYRAAAIIGKSVGPGRKAARVRQAEQDAFVHLTDIGLVRRILREIFCRIEESAVEGGRRRGGC